MSNIRKRDFLKALGYSVAAGITTGGALGISHNVAGIVTDFDGARDILTKTFPEMPVEQIETKALILHSQLGKTFRGTASSIIGIGVGLFSLASLTREQEKKSQATPALKL